MKVTVLAWIAIYSVLAIGTATAQQYNPDPAPGEQGSKNIRLISHLAPLNTSGPYNVSDFAMEQELSRPYVYVARANEFGAKNPVIGVDIISIKDPAKPVGLWSWRIEDPELHRGPGSLAPAYVKTHGRYYLFNGFQF